MGSSSRRTVAGRVSPFGGAPARGEQIDLLIGASGRSGGRKSPCGPYATGIGERGEGRLQLTERCRAQPILPEADGLSGRRLGRSRTCPPPIREDQQSSSGVAGVGTPLDVVAQDEVFDKLGCGLLGDSKVRGHVGGGGVTGADPHEGEPVRWSNVVETTAFHASLDSIDKLGCEAQHGNGGFPVIVAHRPC